MQKRGQAAMEFLMTYGWAILVVAIVFGVLAYYFNIGAPDTCKIDQPFTCVDGTVTSADSTISFVLSAVDIQDVTLVEVKNNGVVCSPIGDVVGALRNSDQSQQTIRFNNCGVFSSKEAVTGTIDISYQRSGGLSHIAAGTFYFNTQ